MSLIRKIVAYMRSRHEAAASFRYDKKRFLRYAGAFAQRTKDARRAKIVMDYHVIEKGLVMPEPRPGFGRWNVLELMELVDEWHFSKPADAPYDQQVRYAARVVLAYEHFHREINHDESGDPKFWEKVHAFVKRHLSTGIIRAFEPEMSPKGYFAAKDAPFPLFSSSRHSVRSFRDPATPEGTLSVDELRKAVALATNAPSACNRQHVRVHAVTDPGLKKRLLEIQQGCRGFGDRASAFLVVTASLACVRWPAERNDIYTNGGAFLMNLSYALHYAEIAHCILNWSVEPRRDLALRKLLGLPDDEEVVAVVACGRAPERFRIAGGPRRDVEEVFFVHGGDAK